MATPTTSMSQKTAAKSHAAAVQERSEQLFRAALTAQAQRVDRSFAALLICEYVACLLAAVMMSAPAHRAANALAAVLIGAVASIAPATLAFLHPGRTVTRYVIATAQMIMAGLLIHLTGGRTETHFLVFGALAFLAFYRDWKILATATALATLDLFVRGIWWPESVFGVSGPQPLRWLEHTGWLLFEAAFLVLSLRQNLTELRHSMEQRAELELAHGRTEQASRAKDDFMAVLSHELRTPLTPSLMMLGVLTDDEALPEALRKDLAMVRRNVELEARLIDDLLDLTRVTHGKLQLSPSNLDVHKLLADLLETCQGELQGKGIVLRREFHARRSAVYGDSARLLQVFWNLLRNAIKFTPTNGRIEVRTSDAGEKIRVDISDNGVGIAPEVLPKLFQRFEQGSAQVTRQFGGLGLGLSISRSIVELHRGLIRAESRGQGWGATFTVVLPARGQPTASKSGMQTQLLRLSGVLPRRVLLVDDHADTRETLARLLTKANYEVTQAGSIEAALQKAEEAEHDILVSDIGLPDGTGHDLMRVLRERYNIRGVAFSGYGMEEDIRKSLDAGFDAHLTKPVDFQRLKEAMGQALQGKNSPPAAAA